MWGPAKGFRGKVLVVTGINDREFYLPEVEECKQILKETVEYLFPGVEKGEYFAVADTTHALTLHYSAHETFKRAYVAIGEW